MKKFRQNIFCTWYCMIELRCNVKVQWWPLMVSEDTINLRFMPFALLQNSKILELILASSSLVWVSSSFVWALSSLVGDLFKTYNKWYEQFVLAGAIRCHIGNSVTNIHGITWRITQRFFHFLHRRVSILCHWLTSTPSPPPPPTFHHWPSNPNKHSLK